MSTSTMSPRQRSSGRKKIRSAVIGVGRMGRNHARIASELPGVELVAIADAAEPVAREVAGRHGVPAYTSPAEMLRRERPELVVVAVPTSQHVDVGLLALRSGAHTLIEKPIAPDLRGAARLVAAAKRARRQLHVGHIERFNPAVIELARRVHHGEAGKVLSIRSQRLSPIGAVTDAGVILDLATHDIDIMRMLVGADPTSVWAIGRHHRGRDHEDWAAATLTFPGDAVGLLEVNWVTPQKVRTLSVLGDRGMFVLDYVSQELRWYQRASVAGGWQALTDLITGGSEGAIVQIPIAHVEPLRAEWVAIAKAIRKSTRPAVSGEDGRRTLEVALALLRSTRSGKPVALSRQRPVPAHRSA